MPFTITLCQSTQSMGRCKLGQLAAPFCGVSELPRLLTLELYNNSEKQADTN